MSQKTTKVKTRISIDFLRLLQQKQEAIAMLEVEHQQATADFKATTAKAIKSIGKPIASSIVCMLCGGVRTSNTPQCPDCNA